MGFKIFLDTNILIDILAERNFELASIYKIIGLSEREFVDIFLSESVITNVFYVLRKEKRIQTLPALREICKTANLIPFSKDILYYPLEKFKDIEDGILYFMAAKAKMDYFITRNIKDFTFLFPSLPVVTPSDFIKRISNDLS